MKMHRTIALLLMTGTVWAHLGLDKLILKDGTYYQGRYVKTESKIRYFEPQAVLDARKDAKKWIAYPLLAGLTFVSSIYGTMTIAREEPWESFPATLGISAASLTIPYLSLRELTSEKTENFNSKDKQLYEKIYLEEYKRRKYKNIMISAGATALIAGAVIFSFFSNFGFGSDYDIYVGP